MQSARMDSYLPAISTLVVEGDRRSGCGGLQIGQYRSVAIATNRQTHMTGQQSVQASCRCRFVASLSSSPFRPPRVMSSTETIHKLTVSVLIPSPTSSYEYFAGSLSLDPFRLFQLSVLCPSFVCCPLAMRLPPLRRRFSRCSEQRISKSPLYTFL